MAHSQINRRRMLGWIAHCLDKGLPLPTDGEIVDEFGFHTADQARTLLADLSDRGDIRLTTTGGRREISLPSARPAPAAPDPAPAPLPVPEKPAMPAAAKKNLNLAVPIDLFDRLAAEAAALMLPTGRHALNLLEAAAMPAGKPRISASAIRAANDSGLPFWDAIAAFIESGAAGRIAR